MNEKRHVTSAAEWKALPQIVAPTIAGTQHRGSRYMVHTVGFVVADKGQCDQLGLRPIEQVAGKMALPTALVEFGGEKQLCRLPMELTPWAITVVSAAHAGQLEFPTEVEIGVLDGRIYAELI